MFLFVKEDFAVPTLQDVDLSGEISAFRRTLSSIALPLICFDMDCLL